MATAINFPPAGVDSSASVTFVYTVGGTQLLPSQLPGPCHYYTERYTTTVYPASEAIAGVVVHVPSPPATLRTQVSAVFATFAPTASTTTASTTAASGGTETSSPTSGNPSPSPAVSSDYLSCYHLQMRIDNHFHNLIISGDSDSDCTLIESWRLQRCCWGHRHRLPHCRCSSCGPCTTCMAPLPQTSRVSTTSSWKRLWARGSGIPLRIIGRHRINYHPNDQRQ